MKASMTSLLSQMASGAAWTMTMRLADRLLGLISTLILVRLLMPADFGLVAMGTSILAILNAATEFGFTQALLQRAKGDVEAYDSAWSLSILTGTAIAAVVMLSIPPAISFYGDPRVAHVLTALAVSTFVLGWRNVWVIAYEQELDFRPLFNINVTKKVCTVAITVSCAVWLRDYRALLIGMITGAAVDVVLSYLLRKERPTWRFSQARSLFDFSKWWLLSQFTATLGTRGQDILIGRRLGAQELGAFSVANEFATMPTTVLISPIMRAAYPGYLKMRDEPDRLADSFIRIFAVVAIVSIPAAAGIFFLSNDIVSVVLGSKWEATAPLLGQLSLLGGVGALLNCFWPIVLACRGPIAIFRLAVLQASLSLPTFGVLLWLRGLEVAVWGLLAIQVFIGVVWFGTLRRIIRCEGKLLLGSIVRPVLGVLVMWAAIAVLGLETWRGSTALWKAAHLLLICSAGALVYGATVMSLWIATGRPAGAESDLLTAVQQSLRRWRPNR